MMRKACPLIAYQARGLKVGQLQCAGVVRQKIYAGIGLELDSDRGVPATDQHSSQIKNYLGHVSRLDRKKLRICRPNSAFLCTVARGSRSSSYIINPLWGLGRGKGFSSMKIFPEAGKRRPAKK